MGNGPGRSNWAQGACHHGGADVSCSTAGAVGDCAADNFPIPRNGTQSLGLLAVAGVTDAAGCLAACCAKGGRCTTWNFNLDFKGHRHACYVGTEAGVEHNISGWVGGSKYPPGPPSPRPGPHPRPAPTPAAIGGQRAAFQPLRRDWPFVDPGFDDTGWPAVGIPHDFVINGSFAPDDDAHRAFLPRGVGLYRKHFQIPASWADSVVQLVFDAALQHTEVYLNGQHLTDHRGGYTRFVVRLDNCSVFEHNGTGNVIAIRVDARWGSGHWCEHLPSFSLSLSLSRPFPKPPTPLTTRAGRVGVHPNPPF